MPGCSCALGGFRPQQIFLSFYICNTRAQKQENPSLDFLVHSDRSSNDPGLGGSYCNIAHCHHPGTAVSPSCTHWFVFDWSLFLKGTLPKFGERNVADGCTGCFCIWGFLLAGDCGVPGQHQGDCAQRTKWAQKLLGFISLKYPWNSLKEN